MSINKHLILGVLLCSTFSFFSQSNYQGGLLPSLNFNKNITEVWQLNFEIESRQQLAAGFFENPTELNYEYILTDFTAITSRKVGVNGGIGVGYLFRVSGDKIIQRSLQQYTFTRRLQGVRLGHRIRVDQTFENSKSPVFRARYRFGSEFSLNGQDVDPKEWYLKINNEYLGVFETAENDLEIRLVPVLGYVFTDTNKIEAGLDYRVSNFIDDVSSHRFWFAINWYLKLD
ncbi:DUF2490 domain-containing protein [Patiriisocius hiemis]|uniref:DUF2490 domain-containing protein n=1 Tax=Patiriisocius hiemis TaxID=3075604 RepID=A0ABU2YAB9_9FLAO|nr:DUF2490 domain-containing protein [Constantimarinum sp. W242]MDT0555140.1 DUF2490 domain-containing protein [Constantimarinum sp. W242]